MGLPLAVSPRMFVVGPGVSITYGTGMSAPMTPKTSTSTLVTMRVVARRDMPGSLCDFRHAARTRLIHLPRTLRVGVVPGLPQGADVALSAVPARLGNARSSRCPDACPYE